MKLYYSTASPYVRKVMVVAHETGLAGRIDATPTQISPINPSSDLNADNPLGKVPCLITDDGDALYDSRVICEYLDSLHDGAKLFPAGGSARWTALRRQALADGMLDAAVLTRYETFLRPQELRWSDWIDSQKLKFRRPLAALEQEAGMFQNTLDIGTLTIACALGYLDFRYADEDWRADHPQLADWFAGFSQRPSLAQTIPT